MSSIYNCFHPVTFKNPYTGEIMSMPCGHCPACLSRKQYQLVNSLILEKKSYKYCFFFTLTYRNEDLPFICDDDGVLSPGVYLRDVQLFVKRLRKYLQLYSKSLEQNLISTLYNSTDNTLSYDKIKQEISDTKIRYFICSEYGPKTKRPHYHGLLFTDSEWFSKQAYTIISKAWQHGFVNCSLAGTKSVGYVAKYVTSSLLQSDSFQTNNNALSNTFATKSKQISLKYFEESTIGFREIVLNGLTDYVCERDGKVSLQGFPSAFVRRWFPKCRQFSVVSHKERLGNYLSYYRQEKPTLKDVPSTIKGKEEREKRLNSLLRDYYCSRQFIKNCNQLNISFDKYLTCIEDFYRNVDYKKLTSFYKVQEEYSKTHDYRFLNNLYSNILYAKHRKQPLPYSIGNIDLQMFSHYFYYDHDEVFKLFVSDSTDKVKRSLKTKVLNDELNLLNNE